ncbi:MAG TPA: glycosyltransferase family 39 protein [Candidatus Thermoplasmatota archaeon]|nr:glycosyltransferase family 39 protein [Candidatus Thermoplasmatota archaeon]
MALPTADASTPSRWRSALRWRRLVEAVEAYPLERIGLAALAAGVTLRLMAPFLMDFRSDGDTYTAMGHAWMMRHEFLMPYGDVTTWGPTPPAYSNHYPPAYPFFLGIVFTLFGFGLWQAKWAAVFVALASLGVVYATTRDLYGRTAAALAAGILAVEPHLLWVTGAGFSENMVLMFFALTMWAIVRSLKDDRYIVLAGLFAALAYLSRASVGYFFVVAGMGGLLWRFYYRRWKVFTNVWYMLAIALFASIALAWATRNVLLFGWVQETVTLFGRTYVVDVPLWETSSYTRYVQELALSKPDMWRHALWAKVPFFLAFLAWYTVPMLPETWKATKRIREEETSALWLSVFLVWVIAWIIAGMFWVFEQSSLYWLDNRRYVLIGCLPLLWLVLREARTERASFRLRYVLLALSLFAACGSTILSPVKFSDLRAAEHMDPYLREGDEVAVDGNTIKYAFYPYLTHPEKIQIYGWGGSERPHFIVSLKGDGIYGDEYTRVGEFRQTYWNGGVMTAYLLARDDVIAARGIETGVVYSS